ncbi:MAG TPA: GAF domain-containing protein [Methylomirabilota bacterium]|nr:GAF domain-containing protein [Methylomirabilota bacterium]
MRRRAKPPKVKVQGQLPVAKTAKSDDARVRDLEKRLAEAVKREAEAREQQTATAEILRVISNSPSDYQPVFDTIVRNAGVVCGAADAMLWTVEGDELVVHAHHGPLPARIGARQPIRGSVAGHAVHEARVIHIEDVTAADDFPVGRDIALRLGWRTVLSAPLLRAGFPIGAILIRRREVRPFTESQIVLLQTFADQAVIAIENVRLFHELEEKNRALTQAHAQVTESLEHQTATSEILRVISRSPTDVQPVFDTIAEAAMRLCGAHSSLVTTFDGELLHLIAQADISPEGREVARDVYPRRPSRGSASGRTVMTRAIVQIPDVTADPEYDVQVVPRVRDFRSILAVPMLRNGLPIGTINAHKAQPGSRCSRPSPTRR